MVVGRQGGSVEGDGIVSIATRLVRDEARGEPVPAGVPGEFVIYLLEDTGMMDRGEAELLMAIFAWIEVEAQGFPDLLEGLSRLRGAVMKAAAVGEEFLHRTC